MNEKQLQSAIVTLCRLRRCQVYHSFLSIKSEPGFPDLVIAREGLLLFREIKTDRGKVTEAQAQWLQLLRSAGADASVWREADLKSGRIAAELAPAWAAA